MPFLDLILQMDVWRHENGVHDQHKDEKTHADDEDVGIWHVAVQEHGELNLQVAEATHKIQSMYF